MAIYIFKNTCARHLTLYIFGDMPIDYSPYEMRQRLRDVLEEKDISMRAASIGAGQGESYLAGILSNGRDPQLSRLIAVCDYLDVSLSWVLYGFYLPPGSDEIFRLLSENPDSAENIVALLRAQSSISH